MFLVLALLACTSKGDDTAAVAAPTLTWLSPTDGATVTAGDVACSTVIDGFSLTDPGKHNDGAPIGYVEVTVDDVVALDSGATNFTVSLSAGSHTLGAQLFYSDGDEVSANATSLCEEDSTDTTCAPVMAMITVTAE